jgi:arylsulfatase A-like enzyme
MSGVNHNQELSDRFSRRDLLRYSLYAPLASALASVPWIDGCAKKQPGGKIENVILISIDTLRADHLGCYGYDRPTTPILDKFASKALLFEDVSTPCPWTLPSHGSMLTGLYPSRNGLRIQWEQLPDDVPTLPGILGQHGFATAGIVNSHWLSPKNGLHRGFEHFVYVKEYVNSPEPSKVEDEGLRWLANHSGRPFFLFLHYFDVHSDYTSLPRYQEQFVRPYSGIVDGSTEQLLDIRYGRIPPPNEADVQHLIDLYDASIRQMDDGLGRVFNLLEQKDLYNNTLIIVTSDHGEEFMEHDAILHGRTFFQEVIGIPLIMRGPALPEGLRVKHPASLLDIIPTVLSLLGIAGPSNLDGIDLRQLWQNARTTASDRTLFGEADWNNIVENETVDDIKRMVRRGMFKLHYDRVTKKVQLYNLLSDPRENTSVAAQNSATVDSLFDALQNFMLTEKSGGAVQPLSPEEIERLKSLGYIR